MKKFFGKIIPISILVIMICLSFSGCKNNNEIVTTKDLTEEETRTYLNSAMINIYNAVNTNCILKLTTEEKNNNKTTLKYTYMYQKYQDDKVNNLQMLTEVENTEIQENKQITRKELFLNTLLQEDNKNYNYLKHTGTESVDGKIQNIKPDYIKANGTITQYEEYLSTVLNDRDQIISTYINSPALEYIKPNEIKGSIDNHNIITINIDMDRSSRDIKVIYQYEIKIQDKKILKYIYNDTSIEKGKTTNVIQNIEISYDTGNINLAEKEKYK